MEEDPQTTPEPTTPELPFPEPAPADPPPAAPDLPVAGDTDPADEPTDPGSRWSLDEWDLKPESLPEPHRPVAERLTTHYREELDRMSKELEDERERTQLYRQLREGQEDPRVGEYATKIETLEADSKTLIEEREAAQKELETLRAKIREHDEAKIRKEYEDFQKEHAWIFEDDKVKARGVALMDEGWGPTNLPDLLRLPKEDVAFATGKLKENPHARDEILELAKLRAEKRLPRAANLVGGAETPTITSPTPSPEVSNPESDKPLSLGAAERAINKVKHRSRGPRSRR